MIRICALPHFCLKLLTPPVKTLRRIPKPTAHHQGKISPFKIAKMWLATIIAASLKHPAIVYDNVFFDPTPKPKCATGAPGESGHKNCEKCVWHAPDTLGRAWLGSGWVHKNKGLHLLCTRREKKEWTKEIKKKKNTIDSGLVGCRGVGGKRFVQKNFWQTWWTVL